MRHRRVSAPPSNLMKKRLQKMAHYAHNESMPTFTKVSGSECQLGKDWGLYQVMVFVPRSKHPGPISS